MPLKRPVRKIYTPAERVALVTEVEARRLQDPGKSVDAIAQQLGIQGATYFTWVRRGVRPAPVSPSSAAPRRKASPEELREKAARRYDDAQRQALLAEVERRLGAGESQRAVLAALDLGRTTYQRWLRAGETAPPAFRAVAVATPPAPDSSLALVPTPAAVPAPSTTAPATLTLVSPNGYRIEGLAVASAAELLRVLS